MLTYFDNNLRNIDCSNRVYINAISIFTAIIRTVADGEDTTASGKLYNK